MNTLRGSAALLFIILNTIFACIPLYAMGLLRALLPRSQHGRWTRRMDWIIDYWTGCNRALLERLGISRPRLVLADGTVLSRDAWYLIVCNHQTWPDILLLQTQLRPLIPPIKFFTKRELIWLPFLGQAMWLLGFPYVRRISRDQAAKNPKLKDADRREIERACEGFRLHPTSVLNFTEGTRFSTAKHAAQQARFAHLLNPKVGGLTVVLAGLGDQLAGLLDITIRYPGPPPSFWEFLCGRCQTPELLATLREIPPAVLAEAREGGREALAAWIEDLWQAKDAQLHQAPSQLQ